MVSRKRIKNGDIFSIAIDEDRWCYGQVIDKDYDWYVIYDTLSKKSLSIDKIISFPVMFLVQSFDTYLKNGRWVIIGNAQVCSSINFPKFKVYTIDGYMTTDYKGNLLNRINEQEASILGYQETVSPALLERTVKAKFGIEEWKSEFNSFVYSNKE